MVSYEQAKEIEKKYYNKFKKVDLFWLYMGQLKEFSKTTIEKHLNEIIEESKEIDKKHKNGIKNQTNK